MTVGWGLQLLPRLRLLRVLNLRGCRALSMRCIHTIINNVPCIEVRGLPSALAHPAVFMETLHTGARERQLMRTAEGGLERRSWTLWVVG